MIDQLRKISMEDIDFDQMDPIAKMMLVALINEVQKIQDYVEGTTQRIVERYCSDFIPQENVNAIPAIALINPTFKPKKDTGIIHVGAGATFSYKANGIKAPINYIPILTTALIPHSDLFVLTSQTMSSNQGSRPISMEKKNFRWVVITTVNEVDNIQDVTIRITGTTCLCRY